MISSSSVDTHPLSRKAGAIRMAPGPVNKRETDVEKRATEERGYVTVQKRRLE